MEQDIQTLDFSGWTFFCHADLTSEIAYNMAKAVDLCHLQIPADHFDKRPMTMLEFCRGGEAGQLNIPLHPGAKSEGEGLTYANMDVAPMKPLTDGFSRKYPGVKATSTHFSGASIITRIDSESRAGKPLSDVVLSGQLGVLALIDKKVAARYRSSEREFYREGFKDKEGRWTAYMTNVMVSAYNTRQVKKEETPRVLEDLLKPRWKGKLTMDSQSYVWF